MRVRRGSTRDRTPGVGLPARWATPEPTALDPRAVQYDAASTAAPDTHTVQVGGPSRWASSACQAPRPEMRAAALAEYAVHLAGRSDLLDLARVELSGVDLGCPCAPHVPCHRDILLDVAQPPADPYATGGHAWAITLPRPWASLVLLPEGLPPAVVHTRSWCTDYRGALCVIASRRLDEHGVAAADAIGFDAAWHTRQSGWLGVAVLVDVHRATNTCCPALPGQLHGGYRPDLYHWVWQHGARLARPVFGHGFLGLHPVSWSVLIRPARPRASRRVGRPDPGSPRR
jgi:hypothetical protein